MNLGDLAEDALQRHGERESVVFNGARLTNVAVMDRARRTKSALESLGVGPGDIVAMAMINHPAVYSTFQGIFRTGAAAVPVMFQLTPAEIRYILEDTRAVGVVTDSTVLYKVREAVKGLDHVRFVLVVGGKDSEGVHPPEFALDPLLDRHEPAASTGPAKEDDLALLLYTSGTTGKPKGAMLAHGNLLFSSRSGAEAAEWDKQENPPISLLALPLAHMFGVGVMNSGYHIPARLAGGYSVLIQWFQPEAFLKLIQEHKATSFAAVPTMLSLLLNQPKLDAYDVSSVEEVVVGGAPLPPDLARRFMDRFGCFVREGYGMTENAAICAMNRRSLGYVPGSCGTPMPGMEVAIHDDADNPLPVGAEGEIVCRGPAVMKGYLNRPSETATTLRGGWLHTGDIGRFDEKGFLYVVDRKKDMIIRGGENLYPAEIEAALYEHPDVAEAAVVGVPDAVYGEAVVAIVVPRDGTAPTEAALFEHLESRLAKIKIPASIVFEAKLPKSGVGKILRRELRDRLKEGAA